VFDHVTIRVSDLEASRRFYELAMATLGFGEPASDGHFFEWEDLSISESRDDRPVTRNLHVGLVSRSREAVDGWWQAMSGAGYRDDGAPGLRPVLAGLLRRLRAGPGWKQRRVRLPQPLSG